MSKQKSKQENKEDKGRKKMVGEKMVTYPVCGKTE